jgi:hypothetical protein
MSDFKKAIDEVNKRFFKCPHCKAKGIADPECEICKGLTQITGAQVVEHATKALTESVEMTAKLGRGVMLTQHASAMLFMLMTDLGPMAVYMVSDLDQMGEVMSLAKRQANGNVSLRVDGVPVDGVPIPGPKGEN